MSTNLDAAVATTIMGWTFVEAHGRQWWSCENWTSQDVLVKDWLPSTNGGSLLRFINRLQQLDAHLDISYNSNEGWYASVQFPKKPKSCARYPSFAEALCRASLQAFNHAEGL